MNLKEMFGRRFGADLTSSIVVFLVALPLCMGIAIAAGAPPAVGVISGIVGGLVVGAISGSPLQVSGPAAGLIVVIWQIVADFGWEGLGIIVCIAGLLQFVAGAVRLGRWFRAVSLAGFSFRSSVSFAQKRSSKSATTTYK